MMLSEEERTGLMRQALDAIYPPDLSTPAGRRAYLETLTQEERDDLERLCLEIISREGGEWQEKN